MFRTAKWFAPAIALGALIAFTIPATRAEEKAPAATGSITGKVVDDKGAGVAGAKIRLQHPRQQGEGGGPNGGGGKHKHPNNQATDPTPDQPKDDKGDKAPGGPAAGPGGGQKGNRPPPVAEATTDNDGNFTLSNVPVGDYVLFSRVKGQGRARENVSVKAGETVNIMMTLKIPENPGKGGGGGQGGQGGQKGDAPKPDKT